MSDNFKYCSKCIHRDLLETDEPCKACIDEFFKSRNFIHFEERKQTNEQIPNHIR